MILEPCFGGHIKSIPPNSLFQLILHEESVSMHSTKNNKETTNQVRVDIFWQEMIVWFQMHIILLGIRLKINDDYTNVQKNYSNNRKFGCKIVPDIDEGY